MPETADVPETVGVPETSDRVEHTERLEHTARFEHAGLEMVYTRSGLATGPTFVLVHGIGMGHRVFRGVAEVLDEHGQVLAVDLPGFGDSPEPGSARDLAATGRFLVEFVAASGARDVVLVGHSMGTQVVLEMLVQRPELCDRAVLIAPTVDAGARTALKQAWRLCLDLVGESAKVFVVGLVQYAKAGPRWYVRKLRQMLEHRPEDLAPHVRARVLVLRGETDRLVSHAWARRLTGLMPAAELREIPERGHEAMITSPQPVAQMILEHAMPRRRVERQER